MLFKKYLIAILPPTFRRIAIRAYTTFLIWCAFVWRRFALTNVVFIAVTGSRGKTTTKDMISAVLGSEFSVISTSENFNYAHSVAVTILKTRPWHRFCVVETAASRPGRLNRILAMTKPDIGILLSVYKEHFSVFKSIENVLKEKQKVIACLPPGGIAILNRDEASIYALKDATCARVMTFGLSVKSDFQAVNVKSSWPAKLHFDLVHNGNLYAVKTQLNGAHFTGSVLAAIAACTHAEMNVETIIKLVAAIKPSIYRMDDIYGPRGEFYVRDTYKAAYDSVDAMLDFASYAHADRKIIIIGTLSDYGGSPSVKYRDIARRAAEIADYVIFVNKFTSGYFKRGTIPDNVLSFERLKQASDFLDATLKSGDLVIVKGSKNHHLERLILARTAEVTCWEISCGKGDIRCDRCPRLQAEKTVQLLL